MNDNTKKLKDKLKRGELSFGSWITVGNPIIAEVMAVSGFEWLTIDMEHSAITLKDAQDLIRTIELSGSVPLVRVGEKNPNLIKRVMDAGAHGIIVPMVNNKEDADLAVRSVRYPPEGNRGVGLARAQQYGFGFEIYKEKLLSNSIVIVQIEHIDAVNNLEEILKVEGVDGIIVGPYDISGSLGRPGDFDNTEFKDCVSKIMKLSKKFNKPAGFHVIPPHLKEIRKYIKIGYRFIAISLDTIFLGTLCKDVLNELK